MTASPSRRRLQPVPPSADWRFDLAEGCPAHCSYCYLAASPAEPPIVPASEGTTFENTRYTDPLAPKGRPYRGPTLRLHQLGRTPVRPCSKEHGIEYKLTKLDHPWPNGQAERMNRAVKEATIKAFHYPNLESLKAYVIAFVSIYNFAKHLKAPRWKTPMAETA